MNRVSVAVVLGWWAVAAEAAAAERWVEVKSPNLTVVSNAGEGRARDTAWELEQARAAFAKLWPWASLAMGRPTVVVASKDETTMKRWLPSYWEVKGGIRPVSSSAWGPDRRYLFLRLDAGSTATQEVSEYFYVYRAYVSALLSASLERPLPTWLQVGLGEVYGNTSVRDKEVHVGRVVPWHLRRFHELGRRPLSEILGAAWGTNVLTKDDERDRYDAQCWVLVHYLSFGAQGTQAKDLDRFIRLWLGGRSQEAAWTEVFGDVRAFEAKLQDYGTRGLLMYGRLRADVNIERERFPVRPMVAAETTALQAAVHVAMGRPAEAQAAIQEARAADPRLPDSHVAEGLLADREKDNTRAAEAYGRAAELGSINAFVYYRAAQLAWSASPDSDTLARIRKLLERAVELNESYASAHAYLADVMGMQNEAAAALPVARRALALEPGDAYSHVALGRVLHRLGDDTAARKAGERALDLADNDYERSNARSFLSFLVQDASNRKRQAANEAMHKRDAQCQGGDAAACAELLPDLEHACSEGEPGACGYAGWLLEEGRGLAKDPARAADFQQRACEAGEMRTCVRVAVKQANGLGVPKNEPAAMAALETLCAQKIYDACTELAILYSRKPAAKDRARARELLTRACDGGDASACSLARSFPR
jgi:TPR repeat protein